MMGDSISYDRFKNFGDDDVLFIGRKFSTEDSDPRLCVGKIIERLRLSGNIPWDKERLNSFVRIMGMSAPPSFKAAGGRPSGPKLKDCFEERIYLCISEMSTEISERIK